MSGPTMNPTDDANRQKLSAVDFVSALLRSTAAAWATDWLAAVGHDRLVHVHFAQFSPKELLVVFPV